MNRPIRRWLGAVAASACLAALAESSLAGPAAGKFDFYLLALSWSPTFCAEAQDPDPRQCAGVGHGFVVHGLWPQYEDGWPEYCNTEHPQRLPLDLIETVLDIMPGVGLVGGQWRKHGTCSGLSPADYLALVRAAWERIEIPDPFEAAARRRTASAAAVEAAFLDANPGLTRAGMALACRDGMLGEVRICLDRTLAFRDCRAVDRGGCRAARLVIPEGGG